MITPLFKVDQDDNLIFITIQVKYVKISEVDFFIDNNNFKFYLKPYFLNLFFSDNLKCESDVNTSNYNVDKGILECKIEKETPGTVFKNLDLISTLLVKNQDKDSKEITKKIEEISISSTEEEIEKIKLNFSCYMKDEDSLNTYLLDCLNKESLSLNFKELSINNSNKLNNYGFNNEFSDIFKNREEERFELLDLNPEKEEIRHRYYAKMEKENEDFVPERYYYDLNTDEDDSIKCAINISMEKYLNKYNAENTFQYNEKELNTLMTINKTKLSLLDSETNIAFHFYLQAIDILFAFIYDIRLTDFEHNSESGWTINKLSSVLSNCVDLKNIFYSFSDIPPFDYLEESIRNVLISSFRRVLCYPLYRSIDLCQKIKKDLECIFSKDNNTFFILKFFLRIRTIFESAEPRHILNKIYIDSFIQWVQNYSMKEIWRIMANVIKRIEINKDELKLGLVEIEEEFKKYEEEDNSGM